MYMLTKRTNLLFEEELWQLLAAKAVEEELSVGELVRQAVKKIYVEPEDEVLEQRKKAFKALIKLQQKTKQKGRVDYKALIEYGRKH